MSPNPARQCLELAPSLDELEALCVWVGSYASAQGLSDRSAFRLELLLTEAVTNIVEHGKPQGEEAIEIACERQGENLLVEVRDAGLYFDPTLRAAPVAATSLEAATPGGLGVHLMRQYAKEMCYQRTAGRNHLFLTLAAEA